MGKGKKKGKKKQQLVAVQHGALSPDDEEGGAFGVKEGAKATFALSKEACDAYGEALIAKAFAERDAHAAEVERTRREKHEREKLTVGKAYASLRRYMSGEFQYPTEKQIALFHLYCAHSETEYEKCRKPVPRSTAEKYSVVCDCWALAVVLAGVLTLLTC